MNSFSDFYRELPWLMYLEASIRLVMWHENQEPIKSQYIKELASVGISKFLGRQECQEKNVMTYIPQVKM